MARVVPWASVGEWRRVRDLVFSEAVSEGLGWLHMWSSRGPLPVAVGATRELLMAGEDRLALGCAVTRLVNGLCDPMQGLHARNIRDIAGELELPSLLVDCRHEATHGVLPPLSLLLRCRREALAWLWRRYWGLALRAGRADDPVSRLRHGEMPSWSELKPLVSVDRKVVQKLVSLCRWAKGRGPDDVDNDDDDDVDNELFAAAGSWPVVPRWTGGDEGGEDEEGDDHQGVLAAAAEPSVEEPQDEDEEQARLDGTELRKRAKLVADALVF